MQSKLKEEILVLKRFLNLGDSVTSGKKRTTHWQVFLLSPKLNFMNVHSRVTFLLMNKPAYPIRGKYLTWCVPAAITQADFPLATSSIDSGGALSQCLKCTDHPGLQVTFAATVDFCAATAVSHPHVAQLA